MEKKEDFFLDSKKELEDYLRDRLLLIKLKTADKTAKLIAKFFVVFTLGILGILILLFLSIMAGYFFANLTGSLYSGFAIVTGFYLLLFLAFYLARTAISNSIINIVVPIFFDKDE
jgi:pilus assembly protein TadC